MSLTATRYKRGAKTMPVRVSDGIRTRDRRDHNPELYQLSYAHQAGSRKSSEVSASAHLALTDGAAPRAPNNSPRAHDLLLAKQRGQGAHCARPALDRAHGTLNLLGRHA
jgi:hypothetical protein